MTDIHEPMDVKRVRHKRGSHIEPPLDENWSELDKLRWNAGVMKEDTGVSLSITATGKYFGTSCKIPGGSWSTGGATYEELYTAISNMIHGARLAQELARGM